jgi:diaminopimelate decarboxylase
MKSSFLHRLLSPSSNFSYFPSPNEIFPFPPSLKTPLFITQKSIVANRLHELQNCLHSSWPHPSSIAYSFKTNYHVAQNLSFEMAEVVSPRELNIALKKGYKYDKIIFNGPYKGRLSTLLHHSLTINLDNFDEINQIINSPRLPQAKLGLRLNSSVHPSRFGFNLESGEAAQALKILQEHSLPLSGLHFHVGSDIQDASIYQSCALAVSQFISQNNLSDQLSYLDFGGGFPSHGLLSHQHFQPHPQISSFIESITIPLKKTILNPVKLILEPGRFLVDDATILVAKVVSTQFSSTQTIIVDATINMLPSTWYRPNLIQKYPDTNPTSKINTIIYGSSCQEADILYRGDFAKTQIGDYLIFFCVGAYNQSMSPDFIFPAPPTLFI